MVKPTDVLNRGYTDPNETLVGSTQQSLSSQNIEDTSAYEPVVNKKSGTSRGDAEAVFFEGEGKKRLKDARYTT